ncbi:MAG: hypothetical protein OXQ29_06080 [Rhodospirillaceae bacterium]|nr:hypothetical protein [Rhodospirillaceae bacterium]
MLTRLPAILCLFAGMATSLVQAAAAQERERPERIGGKPNLNGIWQAMNTAHWNLEGHSAEALEQFWQLGAIAAIPAGQSVVVGGEIPYLPEALARRDENRAGWPASDPEANCYMPGIPRATYMPYPFQIIQGEGDVILFSYTYANANRPVYMTDHQIAPVDLWMGRSNGSWDGDTLVIEVNSTIDQTWFDRSGNHHSSAMIVTERYTPISDNIMQYEATIDDPQTFARPWTIRMPLYRHVEENARLLEFNCVEFSEELLYGDLMTRDAEPEPDAP